MASEKSMTYPAHLLLAGNLAPEHGEVAGDLRELDSDQEVSHGLGALDN